jgi:hypothetical protein
VVMSMMMSAMHGMMPAMMMVSATMMMVSATAALLRNGGSRHPEPEYQGAGRSHDYLSQLFPQT